MDELGEQLQKEDTSSHGWLVIARKLSHKLHHHLREEEKKFFQISGKIPSDAQKLRLAGQYCRDYERC